MEQLSPALPSWAGEGAPRGGDAPRQWGLLVEGHTEMFLSVLHGEGLGSPTGVPQRHLGAEIPSQTLILTLQLQDAPGLVVKGLFVLLSVVQLKTLGSGACLVPPV